MIWFVAWGASMAVAAVDVADLHPRPYDPVGDTPVVARTSFELTDDHSTPEREAAADDYLRSLEDPVLPGLAWAVVSPEIRRNILMNEEIERTRARLVDELWRDFPDAKPLRRRQRVEIDEFLELWPGADQAAIRARARYALLERARVTPRRRVDHDAFDLAGGPDDDLDCLIALRADLLARTLARAATVDADAAESLAIDALRIIADVHLITGANRGRRADLFHEARQVNFWPTLMFVPLGGGLLPMIGDDQTLGLVGVGLLSFGAPFVFASIANVARDGKPGAEPWLLPWFARRRLERRAAERARVMFWRLTSVYAHGKYTTTESLGHDPRDYAAHVAGIAHAVERDIRGWLGTTAPDRTCDLLFRLESNPEQTQGG